MDDPKKKKLDRKRIALNQKHEMEYLRRLAREIIKSKPRADKTLTTLYIKSLRLAKAFLKLTKKR